MARKRRLRAKNRFGVVVPIDLAAEDVTMNNGNNLEQEIESLHDEAAQSNTEVVNDFTTGGIDKAMSASMGKVLKANIELVQSNLNAMKEALANIAFKGNKPEFSELDFEGEKVNITINNTLSGCTANKSGVQRVSAGSNLIVTLTADNGKLLRSVTASKGTVSIAQDKSTATVTISNVSTDTSVNITASATTRGSFTASISDSRVSGTGAASGIVEGSAWSSQLSLNSTAEEDSSITAISAQMDGGGQIEVNGNTVNTNFVTGDISITVTVAVVGKFNVTLPSSSKIDCSDTRTQVPENSSYSNTLSLNNTAEVGEVLHSINATMEGGGTITVNGNTISTEHVTGDIVIMAQVGAIPTKVHSYAYPSTTDNSGDCLEDTARDGDFNLYKYNDDTKGTFNSAAGTSYTTGSYASGSFANGIYDGYRLGKAGDGSRNLRITRHGDFTLVLKDVSVSIPSSGNNSYNSQQFVVRFCDRGITEGLQDTNGQFSLSLATDNAASNTGVVNVTSDSAYMWAHLSYNYGGAQKSRFYIASTGGKIPAKRPTIEVDGQTVKAHTYHIVVSHNATALTATAWIIDIDNSTGTPSVVLAGTIELSVALNLPCIQMPGGSANIKGLDVYNYAMVQADVETEFNVSNE